jgi:peroxiredoxin
MRQVLVPVLAVAAIVGIILWLEARGSAGVSPQSGVGYGPVDLPAALSAPQLSVGTDAGNLAPDFLLEGLDGGDVQLSKLRGQPVVINFWATWCQPCRQEMPNLVKAYNQYQGQGLVILGVNLQEGKGIIEPFAQDFGITYPIAIDRTGSVGDKYHLLGLPTTYFVDRNGVIKSEYSGPFLENSNGTNVQGAIDVSELTKRIQEILAQP